MCLFQIKTPRLGHFIMGRITGLEPATFGTTNQRSNQLSYIRHTELRGGADRTRTDEMRAACHQVSQPEPTFNSGGADRTRTDEMRAACHQVSQPEPTLNSGGADRTRTDDPLHAMQVLYQLSYNPMQGIIL